MIPILESAGPVVGEVAKLAQADAKHHTFSPSTMKNRSICAGWKKDTFADTVRADEGTKMHLAFEKRDYTGLDAEQIEQVKKCVNYVVPYEKGAIEIHREVKLSILDGLTFGTADEIVLRMKNGKRHLDVFDEKYGRESVDDAETNLQGWSYVIGAMDRFLDAETCSAHFLMPRRDEVTRHTFTRADLPRLKLIVSTIIARCEEWDNTRDPALLTMEETNCMRCGRKGTCPLSTQFMLAHAKKYEPLEVAEEVHSSQITDPAKMAQFYTVIRVLEKMVESGKRHVMDFVRQGNALPGYSFKERSGSTKISNAVLAWPVIKETLGLKTLDDVADLMGCLDWSYGDLTKLVREKAPRGKKSDVEGAFYSKLSDASAIATSQGTQYLMRVKTKDTAVDVSTTVVDEAH